MEGEDKVVHLAPSLKVSSKQTRPRMDGHEITRIHGHSYRQGVEFSLMARADPSPGNPAANRTLPAEERFAETCFAEFLKQASLSRGGRKSNKRAQSLYRHLLSTCSALGSGKVCRKGYRGGIKEPRGLTCRLMEQKREPRNCVTSV